MKTDLKLTGNNIYLRPVTLADCTQKYVDWLNDPQVNQYLETRFIQHTLESVRDFIASKTTSEYEQLFAICSSSCDSHIGNLKLGPILQPHKLGDVSLFIGNKDYWGKGYAVEAIQLITDYAFNQLKLNKLKAGAYERNLSSIKSFEKAGFTVEAILASHLISDGSYQGLVMMGFLRSDYMERNQ